MSVCPSGLELYDEAGGEHPARTRTVLHHHGLAENYGHERRDSTRGDVHVAARGERHDDADGLARKRLRPCGSRHQRDDCGERSETETLHCFLPENYLSSATSIFAPLPHGLQRLHVAVALARTCCTGSRAGIRRPATDRRAAEADARCRAVRPIGDLARRHHGARVLLARDPHRHVEIDLLAPGQRRGGERQRGRNRLARSACRADRRRG